MKILQYINSALRKEYGLTVVTDKHKSTRKIKWLKINYTAISPLLFDFDACETLGVDPREMYEWNAYKVNTSEPSEDIEDSIDDTSFDIICTQMCAYTKILEERNNESNVKTNET